MDSLPVAEVGQIVQVAAHGAIVGGLTEAGVGGTAPVQVGAGLIGARMTDLSLHSQEVGHISA